MVILKSKNCITLIDAEKMYPSVKFVQIKNAVNCFLQYASEKDKKNSQTMPRYDQIWYGQYHCYL